jgi:hypothetical protein
MSKDVLLERRAKQVTIGNNTTYGMGLMVDTTYGVPVVQHGGSLIGYRSNMLWLPDHQVGAVVLTNSDSGATMLRPFQRKVLEVLFDGRPEADADIQALATAMANRPSSTSANGNRRSPRAPIRMAPCLSSRP